MNLKDLKGNLFLLVATIIWGCTFVAQDIAAKVISPFEFQAVRTLIGAIVLVPVILIMDGIKKKSGNYVKPTKKDNKNQKTSIFFDFDYQFRKICLFFFAFFL